MIDYGMFSAMGIKKKVHTGMEEIIGREAVVVPDIDPRGKMEFEGEIGSAAAADGKCSKGEKVKIRAFEELVLVIERKERPPMDFQSDWSFSL
jgi:membrane-bound ClpP family serine protease